MTAKKEPKRFFPYPIYTVKPLNFLTVMFENDYHIQCVIRPEFTSKHPQIFFDFAVARVCFPFILREALTLARNTGCKVSFCYAFQCAVVIAPLDDETDTRPVLRALDAQLSEAFSVWRKISKTIRQESVL